MFKKRWVTIFLLVLIIIGLNAFILTNYGADNYEGEEYEPEWWEIDDYEEYDNVLCGYYGNEKDIVIPKQIGNHKIEKIDGFYCGGEKWKQKFYQF